VSGPQPFVFEAGAEVKRHAPATERNRNVIAETLARVLPAAGLVLEVASGTGEHAVHFAKRFPALTWQPSDPDPIALASINAWRADSNLPNVRPAMLLDASADWPIAQADAVVCINMTHISPWAATVGLLRNAARLLPPSAVLFIYGPYNQRDVPLADSNAAFDASLRQQNAEWGLRYVEDIVEEADDVGLRLNRVIDMPANNLSLIFRA
jgi:SAM-dependent methyltransferase